MHGEVRERLGRAETAGGHLEVMAAPVALEGSARSYKTLAEQRRTLGLVADKRPVAVQHQTRLIGHACGLDVPAAHHVADAVAKRLEQVFIADAAQLIRHVRLPVIEEYRVRMGIW